MVFSLKSIVLFAAVALAGLSAGFFYAWSVSVIPGTKKVLDLTYLETMQSINREILNPAFFLIFFGCAGLLMLASIFEFHTGKWAFGLLLGASISYLVGTVGVTAFGNVPLNNQLEALRLVELGPAHLADLRTSYETTWNRLHRVRTAFAVLSFLLAVLALFVQNK